MRVKWKLNTGFPTFRGKKKNKNDDAIHKAHQQPAALCRHSGFGATKQAENKVDPIKDVLSDSESKGFKGSNNAAVAMGTAAWFCRDLSGFV